MPWWQWLLDIVALLLVLAVCYGLVLVVRRRILSRNGGTFELSYRVRPEKVGRGWVLGVGRYSGETLEWFRIFSPSPRPRASWGRKDLTFVGRRGPVGGERMSLYSDHVVVECRTRAGESVELAMSQASLMGLQAWLEARPPGTNWTEGSLR